MFLVTIAQFINIPWVKTVADWFAWGTPLQTSLYALLIIFFTYFYTAVTLNISDMAENMKKYGGFIPGLRPGKPTADYLDRVMTRITLAGSVFLALIAILPNFIAVVTNIPSLFWWYRPFNCGRRGTYTMKQIEALVLMRHYQGFMK